MSSKRYIISNSDENNKNSSSSSSSNGQKLQSQLKSKIGGYTLKSSVNVPSHKTNSSRARPYPSPQDKRQSRRPPPSTSMPPVPDLAYELDPNYSPPPPAHPSNGRGGYRGGLNHRNNREYLSATAPPPYYNVEYEKRGYTSAQRTRMPPPTLPQSSSHYQHQRGGKYADEYFPYYDSSDLAYELVDRPLTPPNSAPSHYPIDNERLYRDYYASSSSNRKPYPRNSGEPHYSDTQTYHQEYRRYPKETPHDDHRHQSHYQSNLPSNGSNNSNTQLYQSSNANTAANGNYRGNTLNRNYYQSAPPNPGAGLTTQRGSGGWSSQVNYRADDLALTLLNNTSSQRRISTSSSPPPHTPSAHHYTNPSQQTSFYNQQQQHHHHQPYQNTYNRNINSRNAPPPSSVTSTLSSNPMPPPYTKQSYSSTRNQPTNTYQKTQNLEFRQPPRGNNIEERTHRSYSNKVTRNR